jgi:hypothetical protein
VSLLNFISSHGLLVVLLERLHLVQSFTPDGSHTTKSGAMVGKSEGSNLTALHLNFGVVGSYHYEDYRGHCSFVHVCAKC